MRDPVDVERLLAEQADKMDFFQLLRLIENAHPARPRIGASLRPRDDAVRFGQDPSLSFHATAISHYTPAGAHAKARLAVNFFGLFGANGPLPLHLTEYARERARNAADPTLTAFLDIFHHRMVSLFYRARAAAEPAISLDRPDGDRYSTYVGSMFGIGAPGLRERDEIGDFAKLHFAGLMANQKRPAAGLATILRAYFKLPVELEQFVGHWMRLPADIQTRIGSADRGNRLGQSAVLGRQVWDCQHKFRLVIGPLNYADYQRLLPGGDSMRRLQAWVRNYAGSVLDWDVQLVLKKQDIPPPALGKVRLGWSTFVASRPAARDSDQLFIQPRALAG
ncbi:MAG TPA: type VI secretion system baseplate subunit TssG [Telluria sp.]|nr:type VI secretion system baseplate subunit TssG [Telluria sp.]